MKTSILISLVPLSFIAKAHGDVGLDFDAALSLLQLRAQTITNSSRDDPHAPGVHRDDPGDVERALCPHEIEDEIALEGEGRFGCQGTLRAEDTVTCAIWGEPHVSETFGSNGWIWNKDGSHCDVLYKQGLFRVGAAADGSWEVQMFNCGRFVSAVAARIGKSIIEVFVEKNPVTWAGDLKYYLNGEEVSLPAEGIHGVKLDSTHRNMRTDNPPGSGTRAGQHLPGTCIDDVRGQFSLDLAQHNDVFGSQNLNFRIVAARDAVTTVDTDEYSLCNVVPLGERRWDNWDNKMVEPENSLFTIGDRMCTGCNFPIGWGNGYQDQGMAQQAIAKGFCSAQAAKPAHEVTLASMCREKGVAVADAVAACAELQDRPEFYNDCQLDFCAVEGHEEVVDMVIEEEAIENPQPSCILGDCEPATKCCNALRDKATLTLDNVVSNDLCNGGELRYGSALIQDGKVLDMVVTAVGGTYACKHKLDDSKNGAKNQQIGVLAVRAGTEQEFEFTFVEHATHNAVVPQNLMMTFLDIDQGRNGKQRESIEVCGQGDAVTTDDTELTTSHNGDCIKVVSSTHGTGQDNPGSVEGMSQMQRARTVAFQISDSSFIAKLGVSKKGRNPRRFNFAGHPSVACVLK